MKKKAEIEVKALLKLCIEIYFSQTTLYLVNIGHLKLIVIFLYIIPFLFL